MGDLTWSDAVLSPTTATSTLIADLLCPDPEVIL